MKRRSEATPSVMVVSHEASRTGAPRVAVMVLEALADLGVERVAMVRWPGPLLPDFVATGARVELEPLRRLRVMLRRFRRTRGLAVRLEEAVASCLLHRRRPSVLYLNTVKSASYVRAAVRRGIPTILHVHEAEASLISSTLGRYRLEPAHYRGLTLVACSDSVRRDLVGIIGVPAEQITVLYSVCDAAEVRRLASAEGAAPPERIRSLTVGMVGTADHRKGVDRWIDLAVKVTLAAPDLDVDWVWVGEYDPTQVAEMLAMSGVADRVRFVGQLTNPYPLVSSFDVFTMTSRHDAFPLAVMEAMILGCPVVGFDIGGIVEQVGDTGVVVAEADIDAMALAVVRLLRDEALRRELGYRAVERVRQLFGLERFGDEVRTILAAYRQAL